MIAMSFEYFMYEVSRNPAGGFWVSPAWGSPLQWGETYESVWVQTLEQCLLYLDVSREDLEALEALP